MKHQFSRHYSRDEARRLLPAIRRWLAAVRRLRRTLAKAERRLEPLLGEGADAGGEIVTAWVRTLADINDQFHQFRKREIQIKDLDRGLIDFPAILEDKEVFLCWEDGEEDIEYWHDLDGGYAGRQKL